MKALPPDPFIQAPGNAQNYNRYAYCLNNPLMYTDPSGYSYLDEMKNRNYMDGDGYWYRGEWVFNFQGGFFGSTSGKYFGGGTGYSYNWGTGQYTYNGQPVPFNVVFNNFIKPNSFSYSPKGDYEITLIKAFNRINIIAHFGPLGTINVYYNGGIFFSNTTATYIGTYSLVPQGQGGNNKYGRPESDALWLISASGALIKAHNEELSSIEYAYRKGSVAPRSVNINTGDVTWVNPKYAKNIKWAGFLGTAGDVANITGIIYSIAYGEGWTLGNISDGIFGVIGFVPVAGDFTVLIYESMKWQVNNPEQAFRHQLLIKH